MQSCLGAIDDNGESSIGSSSNHGSSFVDVEVEMIGTGRSVGNDEKGRNVPTLEGLNVDIPLVGINSERP